MNEILTHPYFGNPLQAWLIVLLIIIGAIILGRIAFWILSRLIKRAGEVAKTRFGGILVDKIAEPVTFGIALVGIRYALSTLELADNVRNVTKQGLLFLVAVVITWMIARLFSAVFEAYLTPLASKTGADLGQVLPVARRIAVTMIWAVGIIAGLDAIGYEITALLAGLGIGGLALALAAQDAVSNIFGGFTIFVDKPFVVGDRVQAAGFDGNIREVGLRSTRLQTLSGTWVTIPNSTFSNSSVENISREPSRRIVSTLGLTYDTPPEKMREAMEILREIAQEHPHVGENVVTSFNSFGDFSMNITFVYYIEKSGDIWGVQSEMNLAVLEKFNAAQLDFAFPTQTIYTSAG